MTSRFFGGGGRVLGSPVLQTILVVGALLLMAGAATAHAVAEGDKAISRKYPAFT